MATTAIPTRERILYAAAELFRRRGYAGTGLKQIVAEARAPFGSLYHHFPGGKQQLADEVIRTGGAFFQEVATTAYDEHDTPEESIRAVFRGAAATLEATDFQDACPIETVALEVASTNEALRLATAAVFEQWTRALIERLDDQDAAIAVICALEGAFVLCRAQRSTRPLLAAGEMAANFVSHTSGGRSRGTADAF